jgi:hypothetical protein
MKCITPQLSHCKGCGGIAGILPNKHWKQISAPLKDELREDLSTLRHANKQLKFDLTVKERCYKTVMKQRYDSDVKVIQLTRLIDDVIYDELSDPMKETIKESLKKIGV